MTMYTPSLDALQLVQSIYDELKNILLSHSDVMPPQLIEIGKAVLSVPGKVMSTNLAGDPSRVRAPRWPLAVVLSYQASSDELERSNWSKAVPAAAAVEIAMAAADLLDEIVDNDPSEVVARYGAGQALNAANLMLVMAQHSLLRRAMSGSEYALEILDALQNMLVEAAVGQHLDMLYEGMDPQEVTVEMSASMTEKKAGALISGACRIGALSAGSGPDIVDIVARFGREIGGIAQIENDLQDVLPQAAVPSGPQKANHRHKTDIQLRKRTLPIVFTLRDDSDQPNALQSAYSLQPIDADEDEDTLREAVLSAGGIQFGELLIRVHRENALLALEELEALRPGATTILSPLLPKIADEQQAADAAQSQQNP